MRLGVLMVAALIGCGSSSNENGEGESLGGGAGDGGGGGTLESNPGGSSGAGGSASGGAGSGAGASGSAGARAGAGGSGAGGRAGAGGNGGASGSAGGGGSASDGGGIGAGDGGLNGYNPCPPKGTACAVMPLGDSITAGAYSSNMSSYRGPLFHLALSHAQTITFVGTQTNGPDKIDDVAFPKHHEGHGGYVIETTPGSGQYPGISVLAPESVKANHPHIVTLMIGTNDVNIQYDLAHAPTRLGNLLDGLLAADPNMLLVVAQITPTKDDAQNVRIQTYNAAIVDLVKARVDAGKHIAMVDMYGAFTANPNYKTEYMGDNLHPIDAGHAKMADVWYARIGGLFR